MKRIVTSVAIAAALFVSSSAFAARGDFIDPTKLRDTVRIRLGQEFAVAFDERGDRLVNPRRARGAQKRPAVTLKFFVPPDHKNLLVLIVGSSYPRIVRYRAAARAKGHRDFIETNMLPLNPNVPVYEGWNDPWEELILFDFHLTNEKPPKTA
ncbi:MAG: hypothetical protein LC753_19500 [Acidobacteria bacterium]|nr:hypothetical protein [Acidobacteriota bacterium]